MNHWNFILGAYGVTVVLMLFEVLALRARRRTAIGHAQAGNDAGGRP